MQLQRKGGRYLTGAWGVGFEGSEFEALCFDALEPCGSRGNLPAGCDNSSNKLSGGHSSCSGCQPVAQHKTVALSAKSKGLLPRVLPVASDIHSNVYGNNRGSLRNMVLREMVVVHYAAGGGAYYR